MFALVRNPLPTTPRRIAVGLTAVAVTLRRSPYRKLKLWAGVHVGYASLDVLPIFYHHAQRPS